MGTVKIPLDPLGDHKLFELSKATDGLNSDLNDVLAKITSFVSSTGIESKEHMVILNPLVNDVIAAKNDYMENLSALILSRDLCEEKLRNVSGLNVHLGKFTGYESEMDIFTFRSQFKKLVEPHVQSRLLVDVLKGNHLGSNVLKLVKHLPDIETVWKKLFESFGSTELLLHNKLGELDKMGGLLKARGNEKVTFAISGMLNCLTDLSNLATDHSLESSLYHASVIDRILLLIGDHRRKRFLCETLGSNLSGVEKWNKIISLLNNEMRLCVAETLFDKSTQIFGLRRLSNWPLSLNPVRSDFHIAQAP